MGTRIKVLQLLVSRSEFWSEFRYMHVTAKQCAGVLEIKMVILDVFFRNSIASWRRLSFNSL